MKLIHIAYILIGFFLSASLNAQEQALDFQFKTTEGLELNLDSLNGEVVYLSFWATWCKPCISNFKKYFSFRESLAEAGVHLLNVNLDEDYAKFENFLLTNKTLNGTNAYPTDRSKLMYDYKISSIPEYHIINKEGQFVFLSEDPDRDIMAEFKKWLDE